MTFQESLTIQAEMDFCYWRLSVLNETEKRTPLEAHIDSITGFQDSKDLEKIKTGLYYLRHIVKCRLKLGLETQSTEETIAKLLDLRKKLKRQMKERDKSSKFKRTKNLKP